MTIIFEAQNANEDFVKLVKSVAKLANVKLKTQKKVSADNPELKDNFIPYAESEAYKIGRKREKERTLEEQANLEKEVEYLIGKGY